MLAVRRALAIAFALTGLVLTAPAGAQASTSGAALFNRLEYQVTPSTLRADAHRYSVMVMWSDDARYVALLHRLNPRLQILMYQNVPFSTVSDQSGGMDCTTVPQDLAHPSWLARTTAGTPIAAAGNYSTNLGDPGYQRACIGHAIALARQGGFNGIFLDGVCARFAWTVPQGASIHPVQFPTDAAYQAAVYSLLSYAGPTVHSAGLKLFANISAADSAGWARWSGPLDGAMEESWTDGGSGLAQQVPYWREKLANAAWSEAHGKYVLLHSYNGSEAANTYGLAAMLLIANGHASYSTSNSYVTTAPWLPEYTTAKRLGRALGGYRILRGGAYERRFAHGIVIVNPTLHRTRRIRLRGRYSGTHLRHVRAVALAPLRAVILTRG